MALAVFVFLALAAPAAAGSSKVVVKAAYNKVVKATILVDGSGRSLYLYSSDRRGVSACAKEGADCTNIWYALKAGGHVKAGAGVKASLLGTTTDGKQVTYNGHPLYYFHGGRGAGLPDRKPGQVYGQGLFGVWWVVSPKGNAIKKS
jgi:predicted lipoprotein with Yx(FWY)xxD motif